MKEAYLIMLFLFTSIILVIFSGLAQALFKEKSKAKIFTFFSGIATTLGLIPTTIVLLQNKTFFKTLNFNGLIGNVNFVLDPLSAFFVLIILFIGFLAIIYSGKYLENYNKDLSSHYFFLGIFIASMILVVTVQNTLFFLICWEIMSLSSFFLVIFEDNKKEVLPAGINYLIYMHISVVFIILGFILLYIKSGSLDFSSFKVILETNKVFADTAFIIIFTGFAIKAGFVPFHNWLPKAHPAAPSHVSGIMSGVMIKMGIYGILRILSLVSIPSIGISYFVLIISVISALYGVLYALAQHDLKKLLAYHSIENIGIIGIGIGIGMLGLSYHNSLIALLGFSGGILHVLNHSIFKGLLFLAAGAVYKQTHTKNIEKLGGLIKTMPATAILFLTGSVAISGLPPFNGFISEFLIYLGLLKGFAIKDVNALIILVLSIASLALVGTMALLCFTKAFSIVFLGIQRSEEADCEQRLKGETTLSPGTPFNASNQGAKSVECDVSKVMILPMSILAALTLLIGIFPQFALKFVLNPTNILLKNNLAVNNIFPIELMRTISGCCFLFLAIVVAILFIRQLIIKNKKTEVANTWGCGYKNLNNRMQYTASSYVSPFLSMLKPLFIKHFNIRKPKELFPKEAHFNLDIQDIEEFYILNPTIKANKIFLSKFQWIQGGNTQRYILYGLIFLVLALIGAVIL